MKLIVESTHDVTYLIEEKDGKKQLFIEGVFLQAAIKNGNGRIYPVSILEREVARYVKEHVERNTAYGELNHPQCFSGSAELLTQTGWKAIKDVRVGEKIFSLNPHTQKTEIVPVLATHASHYKGDMVRIKGRVMDTMVTPNHRFVAFERNGSTSFYTADDIKFGLDNKLSRLAHCGIPKVAPLTEEQVSPQTIMIGDLTFDFDKFAAFLGIYLAEGYAKVVRQRPNAWGGSYRVSISQNEGVVEEEIGTLLENLHPDLKWRRYQRVNGAGNVSVSYTCSSKTLADYLEQLGKHHEKFIPDDVLEKLDATTAHTLLTWFQKGDGRGDLVSKRGEAGYQGNRDVFSTSARLINNLGTVAVMAGFATHEHVEITTEDYVFANRVIRAARKRPLYLLKILRTNKIYLDSRHLTAEYVPFDDMVYCVTTENSTFMARDNGYNFWTGNSPQINLDRVALMVKNLRQEGNDFVGKAKIMSTPMGNIARSLIEDGANLGVSSRGVGTLKRNKSGYQEVCEDYRLVVCSDIVANPSAPHAFVQGIMENVDWKWDEQNGWVQGLVEDTKHDLETKTAAQIREQREAIMTKFFTDLVTLKSRYTS